VPTILLFIDTDCPKFDVEVKRALCFYKYNILEAWVVVV